MNKLIFISYILLSNNSFSQNNNPYSKDIFYKKRYEDLKIKYYQAVNKKAVTEKTALNPFSGNYKAIITDGLKIYDTVNVKLEEGLITSVYFTSKEMDGKMFYTESSSKIHEYRSVIKTTKNAYLEIIFMDIFLK